MSSNPQQGTTSREVLEAREFLKAACSQPSGDMDSRASLAGRLDFLSKCQAQPSMDPSLALLSKNWFPVGTRPIPTTETSERAEKSILHRIFSQQPPVTDPSTAEAFANLQAQATARLPQQVPAMAEGDEAARRGRKRERQSSEVVVDARWALKQKLAALTQDIELLTQEVALVRDEADASCAAPRLTLEEKAAIAERHAKKQAEAQKRGIAVMLRDIMGHKFANPFLKPVDTKLYPDYPLKVANPLDFGTVKGYLDAGKYTGNMEAFAKDMSQIFENAFTYNARGSTVHDWAVLLRDKFEERFKSLNVRLAGMEGEQLKEEEDVLDIAKRRLQDRAWEGLAVERQRFEPLIAGIESRIKELKAEAAASCTFVSVAEQHALMYALQELKAEDYDQAMQIIINRHPGLLQNNPETLNIDCGPLDALTLRQLAAFCHFCLKGTKPEFANAWPGLLFGTGARGIAASGATQQPQSLETLPSDADRMQKVSLTSSEALPGDRKDQAQASAAAPASNLPAKVNPQPEVVAFTDPKGTDVKALSVQTRDIGERSWSVLDTEAVTGLKAELKAAASQIGNEQ